MTSEEDMQKGLLRFTVTFLTLHCGFEWNGAIQAPNKVDVVVDVTKMESGTARSNAVELAKEELLKRKLIPVPKSFPLVDGEPWLGIEHEERQGFLEAAARTTPQK